MIRVVQGDLKVLSQFYSKQDQVMQADRKENLQQEIRKITAKALRVAEEQRLKALILPVVNTRGQEISVEEMARIMVSEARRHMSLGAGLNELTFALTDPEGVQAFEEVIYRNKILCLGDSITYGYPDGPAFSWVTRVIESTGYQMLNRGINGETTGQMLVRMRTDVIPEKPAYLIFAGGHNDGWQKVSLGEVKQNVRQVVGMALEHGICPVMVLPSPLNIEQILQCYEGSRQEAEDYNNALSETRQWIGQYAQEMGFFALDFYTPLLVEGSDQGNPQYLLDGGHPTHEGYRVLGDAAIKQLAGRLYL
ncbi:lipolytic enzyme, G-D-S-L family [Desulforamulus reducens MI-1]|uniref:Lipolytic enzyme, G-D-S-L family n=1 Tax=Desulforamulus reducens (strain ATCC BAA-1160 / DSM 100696 / MI-1) TaxID=349161 RepID=A4J6W7_DESRM|nr:GDSL-type esterase/lipase family protein [Desulforamulus reducens]ABO50820.1 lipolytic enzyme, G-D-S-L family [Desulforamulus reducens MI-1]